MRELTRKEREWLLCYCMKPENTWLALAIGQIQPALGMEILGRFLEELEKSVQKNLKKNSQWKTEKIMKYRKMGEVGNNIQDGHEGSVHRNTLGV